MKKVIRVGTYPTSLFKSMGRNSYMISSMESINTIFVCPRYEGSPLPVPKNTTLKTIPFIVLPAPEGILRIFHEIKRIFYILNFSFTTFFLIIKEKPDIIHIHSPMFFLIAIFGRLYRARCFITYHGNEHKVVYSNKILGNLFNSVFYKTFSLSSDILLYKKSFPHYKDSFLTIDNAVDQSIFFNKHGKRDKIILAVGRLEYQKDYPSLIEAFKNILDDYPDYKLYIAGSGQLENKLKDKVRKLGILKSVKFLGQVPNDALPDLYNKAEIFVLSSFWEGFPKVLLEAMACGCKVVSTKVDSAPRVLGADYPFFAESGNTSDLFNKIKLIIEDDRNITSKYNEILKNYSWDKIRSFMEGIYNKK